MVKNMKTIRKVNMSIYIQIVLIMNGEQDKIHIIKKG